MFHKMSLLAEFTPYDCPMPDNKTYNSCISILLDRGPGNESSFFIIIYDLKIMLSASIFIYKKCFTPNSHRLLREEADKVS